jgi:MFS family permease
MTSQPRRGSLWRHTDFLKLWGGQSISEVGTQVTVLALPTAAIVLLHAGPVQIGALEALQFLAFPILGTTAGVWADRLPRRPIMVVCDATRAVALASIPATWLLGHLSMAQLFAVAVVTGIASVFFDVSYQSYLPSLVEPDQLVDGNGKLELTRAGAGIGGPALAGALIQLFQAPAAILADAISYVVSVLSLLWIRAPEPRPGRENRRGFLAELWEGVVVVARHRQILLITACTATSNLGSNIAMAVYLLFAYHRLHLSPGEVGGVFAVGSVGAVLGALVAGWLGKRIGMGVVLFLSIILTGSSIAVPLAAYGLPLVVLGATMLVTSIGVVLYNVNQVSYRQAAIPVRLQGRLNATVRTVIWGTIPIGSALGGVLGARIGLVPTLYLGGVVEVISVFWILAGPIRLREAPPPQP